MSAAVIPHYANMFPRACARATDRRRRVSTRMEIRGWNVPCTRDDGEGGGGRVFLGETRDYGPSLEILKSIRGIPQSHSPCAQLAALAVYPAVPELFAVENLHGEGEREGNTSIRDSARSSCCDPHARFRLFRRFSDNATAADRETFRVTKICLRHVCFNC